VAVWLGYDNAVGKRRTLGGGSTGGGVAVPIFEPVMQAAWAHVAPKAALAPPSPDAKRHLSCQSVDAESGEAQRRGAITECFRIDQRGRIIDTQYKLLSHESAYARHGRDDDDERPTRVRRQRDDDDERPARGRSQRAAVRQDGGYYRWRPFFFWGR
jgi:penicillin-binding protein 1A